MIQVVDTAVEKFLRDVVPLPETTVDVAFEAPQGSWSAALTRPTVNCFLWQVNRSPGAQVSGTSERVAVDGSLREHRRSLPVVDLHYLVTAWATELRDEHQLLGSVLEAVLSVDVLPDEVLPERLSGTRCRLGLASHEVQNPGELWSSLNGQLKPSLQVVVTLPFAVFPWRALAPEVSVVAASVRDGRAAPQPAEAAGDEPVVRRRRNGSSVLMEGRPPSTGAR